MASQPPPREWQSSPSHPYGYGQRPPTYGPPVRPKRSSGFAIAALVLGIAACFVGVIPIVGFFGLPLSAIGLVLGIIDITRAFRDARPAPRLAIVGSALCVLSLVVAVTSAMLFNKAFGHREPSPGPAGQSQTAGTPTQRISADDLDVQFDKFVADANPSLESGKLPVTLTNKGKDSASFKVHLEALDATGKRIADDTAYAPHLAPGQSTTTYMFLVIEQNKLHDLKQATFRIVDLSKY